MSTYVIGDIHGGLKSFVQVFKKSPAKTGDKLIFLGDYVDRFPDSAQLIEYLIGLQEHFECIFLRGNHDKWCEDWLLTGNMNRVWEMQGGRETMDSYIETGFLTKDSHKEFFRKLHNYYIDDENRGFVHGGFSSNKGLGHEQYQSDYYWDRELWHHAMITHPNEEKKGRFYKHKEVYIGHTATNNWNCKPHYPEYETLKHNRAIDIPMNRCNVWNMDTGGGWAGKISIMDIDTKEYWQSDNVEMIYEKWL